MNSAFRHRSSPGYKPWPALIISSMLTWMFCLSAITESRAQADSLVYRLHQEYCNAIHRKDSIFLKELFHDDMIVTSANGTTRNKAQEIADALDARYVVSYFRSSDTDVRIFERTAIVTGKLSWEISSGGKVSAPERVFTFTYVNTSAGWQIVAQHLGRAPAR